MTTPAAPPARSSRGPLFWILGCVGAGGACSCAGLVGLVVLGGLYGTDSATPVRGPSAIVGEEAAAPEVAGVRTTVTVADLVGTWSHSEGSSTDYVDRSSGNYVGSSTVGYGERFTLRKNGTYDFSFQGLSNGAVIRDSGSGTWTLGGSQLSFVESDGTKSDYWFRSYEVLPDGGRVLKVLSARYPDEEGSNLYVEKWVRER